MINLFKRLLNALDRLVEAIYSKPCDKCKEGRMWPSKSVTEHGSFDSYACDKCDNYDEILGI